MTTSIAIATFALLLLGATLAHAQGIEWSQRGYVEAIATGFNVNRSAKANPDNALALPPSDAALQADYTLNAQAGRFKALLEAYGRTSRRHDDQTLRANQLYASVASDDERWYFRVGKLVPNWGVGNIWNPVRSITNEARRDLVFPNQSVEGIDVAQMQVTLDADSSLSLLALPHESDRPAGLALRYSSAIGNFDYALSAYGDSKSTKRLGTELSWVLGPATFVGEAAWSSRSTAERVLPDGSREQRPGSTFSYVIGSNVTLPRDYQFTAEYFHDGDGFSRQEFRSWTSTLPANLDLYNPLGNGRDNLYLGLQRRFLKNDSTLGVSLFHNLQSEVTAVQLHAETQLAPHARLIVTLSRYLEPAGGSQVNLYRSSLDVRLRASF